MQEGLLNMKRCINVFTVGMISFMGGFYLGGKTLAGVINNYKARTERNSANMIVLNDWINFIYSGESIVQYFNKNGFHRIMIYGIGLIGARLQQALGQTDIEVVAVMDKAAHSDTDGMVIGTEADIPDVDCIVVTPVYYYDEIYSMLAERTKVPIVSIKDILVV